MAIDDYFLSPRNPTANVDQRDLEALAIRILEFEQVQLAKKQAGMRWRALLTGVDVSEEAWQRFDEYIDNYVFRYALMAVNSDANHPKVLAHIAGPEHRWFDTDVPASRGGDGPDSNYAVIPIGPNARYEISGIRVDPGPADAPFVLYGSPAFSMKLGSLELEDLHFEPDGRFTITLDPEPAAGRKNHIQTNPDALLLLARDYRSDWKQEPLSYRVRRLDPPAADPLSVEQLADRAARWIFNDMPIHYSAIIAIMKMKENTLTPPINSGSAGGLASHAVSFGCLKLADDEAFVITATKGSAGFHCVALYDTWTMTLDYGNHSSSLNTAQSDPNADGTRTYVVSKHDPGFHNWLDPVGLSEPMVMHRWHQLPREPGAQSNAAIAGQLVKLADLEEVLPAETRRCSPAERSHLISERQTSYSRRFADN